MQTMNSKQRVLAALNNEQPDKVPIYGEDIDEPVLLKLADILGWDAAAPSPGRGLMQVGPGPEMLELYCRLVDELGLDATSCSHSIGLERIADDHVRDKYGCVYLLSDHGEPMVVQGPIKDPSDIAGYDMVSRLTDEDFAGMQYTIDTAGKDRAHFLFMGDPFRTSWVLRGGMEHYLTDYLLNPGLAHRLMRITTDFALAVIDKAAATGIDAFILGGDLAGEITTLMSPQHFREYVKPYHMEVVEHAHQKELKIVKHSDGNVWPILDDFLEVGFDGIHPVQPQCMDIGEVKEHLAGKACIMGNIDCRELLPFGSEEEVAKAVKETIDIAAPGGGYIICSSNTIQPGCKAENYIAMIEAVHKHGKYEGGN